MAASVIVRVKKGKREIVEIGVKGGGMVILVESLGQADNQIILGAMYNGYSQTKHFPHFFLIFQNNM